jgi:putative peptide maturation system protein
MGSLNEHVALSVNGEAVSLPEVLRSAKWRGQLGFLRDVADTVLIRQAAAQRGITVSDEELQQAADTFRAARGLYEAAATHEWLKANRMTVEDWESRMEESVSARKLRDVLTDGRVEQFFAENKLSFDAATISHIVVNDENVAKELLAQVTDEGADFFALARQYSVDDTTRPTGGYVGAVGRKMLAAEAEAAVFGASAGDVVGPIKIDDGWHLIRVERLHPATLNDATRDAVKSLLFAEWLNEQRGKAKISVPLMDEI